MPAVIDPAETICVSFEIPNAPEYRDATAYVVHQLSKWYHWQKDGTTRATDAARLFARLLLETYTVGCCCDEQTTLLQNILTQTTINNSLSISTREGDIISNYRTYWSDDDTDITTIYTFAPTVSTTEGTSPPEIESRRADALCYLAGVLTDYAYEAISEQQTQVSGVVSVVSGAVALAATVVTVFTGGTAIPLGVGITAAVVSLINEISGILAAGDLDDDEVQHEVKCALREALDGVLLNATDIRAAVETLQTAEPTTRAERMKDVTARVLIQMDSIALTNIIRATLGEAADPLIGAGLPACDCDEAPAFTVNAAVRGWRLVGETVWRDEQASSLIWRELELPLNTPIEVWCIFLDRYLAVLGDHTDETNRLVEIRNGTASTVGVFDINGSGTNNGYLAVDQEYTAAQINLWDVEVRTVTILSYGVP